MRVKQLLLLSCIMLSACGTVNVHEIGNTKIIEFTDPPYIGFPREVAFARPEVTSSMEFKSMMLCPEGYTALNKKYSKDKDALIWKIKCNN